MIRSMKARVTVSLSKPLLREAERLARQMGARSRSAAIERALELLVARQRDREIEGSLDAYYGTMTASERAEEERMVRAFNRSQRKRRDLDRER
jgi:metal-responsive CopG/Arc/MetJ family transcriptional regulator